MDYVGASEVADTSVNLDREGPAITPTGTLWSSRLGASSDATLHGDAYALNLDVVDGAKDAGRAQQRSGVKFARVDILNANQTGTVTDCETGAIAETSFTTIKDFGANPATGDSEPMLGLSFDFQPSAYVEGKRLVRILAHDKIDNVTRKCFEVDIPRALGNQRAFAMEAGQKLSDDLSLSVNARNGNLLLEATDLAVPGGLGPDLEVSRSFNSFQGRSEYGRGWTMNTANGVQLPAYTVDAGAPAKRKFFAPGGGVHVFEEAASANGIRTYKTPRGFDATLTENLTANTLELTSIKARRSGTSTPAARSRRWKTATGGPSRSPTTTASNASPTRKAATRVSL